MNKIFRIFKDFFFIKVVNGSEYYVFSSTKTFRTLIMIAVVAMAWLICMAFYLKLFRWWQVPQLTTDVLQVYLGLGGIITILAGVAQWLYASEKKSVQSTYTEAYKQNNTPEKLGTSAGGIGDENKSAEAELGLTRKTETPQETATSTEEPAIEEGGAKE